MTSRYPSATRSSIADTMTLAMARELRTGDVVAVGIGTPLALAATLVARDLDPDIHVIVNAAVDPDTDLAGCDQGVRAFVGLTAGYIPMLETLDMVERQRATLEFLRPAQIDGTGMLNTSRIGPPQAPKVRFPGGLGTADVPKLLPRVIAYLPDHQPRSLPEHVDRITGSGRPWSAGAYTGEGCPTLITDLALIRFKSSGALLEQLRPDVTVEQVQHATGFRLLESPDLRAFPSPTPEELAALERVDPAGLRMREVRDPDLRV
jgi:glutaconate CoA-transferase subunit B